MNNGRRTRVEATRSITSSAFGRSALAPVLSVLGAAALFGTTGTALAKGPDGIEALSAGSLRLLIGGAALCVLSWRALSIHLRSSTEHRISIVLLGGLTVACYQLGFFWATERTGVALATVVTISSAPLISRVIGTVRGRPAPDVWWILSACGLILGLVLLLIGSVSGAHPVSELDVGSSGPVDFDILGVLAAFVAGSSYAAYTEVGSEMMIRGWHPTSAMAAMFFTAGLLTSPLLLVRDVSWFGTMEGLSIIVYLSLVTLTVAYVWFGWGLKRLSPTTVVMLTMFEPVVASVLAITVLDEAVSRLSMAGIVVVLLGLVVVGLRSRPSRSKTAETSTVSP